MFDQIDSMFDRELTNLVPAFTASNYPPYNIVKVDENRYEVYVALAGISKEDIKVYKDGNSLVIEMDRKSPDAKAEWTYGTKDANVIHQGISQRFASFWKKRHLWLRRSRSSTFPNVPLFKRAVAQVGERIGLGDRRSGVQILPARQKPRLFHTPCGTNFR